MSLDTMQPVHQTLIVTMKGALLIGGHGDAGSLLDARTARDPRGQALLPASALRGALREACIRLAATKGMGPCALAEDKRPCAPEKRCVVCQLFGTPGTHRLKLVEVEDADPQDDIGAAGGLRFSDGVLAGDIAEISATRPGVAIDRALGAASQGVLYLREVLDAPERRFTVTVSGTVSAEAWKLFCAALPLVDGIGNSRGRGLGAVQVALGEAAPVERSVRCEPAGAEEALLLIDPLEPLVLGRHRNGDNIFRTLDFIPGSTLLGALAQGALRGGAKEDDPAFQATFVDPSTCIRLSDALPTEGEGLPVPLPLSTLGCPKQTEGGHQGTAVRFDMLVPQALAVALPGFAWRPPACPRCGDPLKQAEGQDPPVSLTRRIVTRVGRDVRTGAAMPGLLYSMEQLLPTKGLRFAAVISRLSPEARRLLAAAGAVFAGQGRSRGQGRVFIEVKELPSSIGKATLADRRGRFVREVGPLLAAAREAGAKALPADAGDLLPVLARTALRPQEGETFVSELERVLDIGPLEPLAVQERMTLRTGWDEGFRHQGPRQKPAPRPLVHALRPGSVWLLRCPAGRRPDDATLSRLQIEGIGRDRHLGLGQLLFFPAALLSWSSAKDETKP